MKTDIFETIVGAVVVGIAAVFFFYAYTTTDSGTKTGYDLTARFSKVDGVTTGSDVRMFGIKIGTVTDLVLDQDKYMAVATLTINDDVQLPEDTSVRITAESLLGGNYVDVMPGGSFDYLAAGDEIEYTQGTVNIMDMVGGAILAIGGDDEDE